MANQRELTLSELVDGRDDRNPTRVRGRLPLIYAIGFDPRIAIGMAVFWMLATLAGFFRVTAGPLEMVFTPAVLIIGLCLCRASTPAYLSFIWQTFFFVCLVRRLTDYQLGWNPTNLIILAPYLLTCCCTITLYRPSRAYFQPLAMIFVALLWALAIGVLRNGVSPALFAIFEWLAGPLIVLHLLAHRAELEDVKSSLLWTAIVGAIAMSAYGLVQFFRPLAWDRYWMLSSMMSLQSGDSGHVRVFSTMNSPWPFAMTLMGILIFVIGSRGRVAIRSVAVMGGLAVLLVSQTRAAWGGVVIGWIALVLAAGGSRRSLLAGAALVVIVGGLSVAAMPAAVANRVRTLGSLEADNSLLIRMRFYESFVTEAIGQPLGAGLGRTGAAARLSNDSSMLNFDSGLMNVPYVLGWVAGIPYACGLGATLIEIARRWRRLSDSGLAAAAACIALLSQMPFLNSLVAATGIIFWTLLGVCLCELRVHADQLADAISRRKSLAGK